MDAAEAYELVVAATTPSSGARKGDVVQLPCTIGRGGDLGLRDTSCVVRVVAPAVVPAPGDAPWCYVRREGTRQKNSWAEPSRRQAVAVGDRAVPRGCGARLEVGTRSRRRKDDAPAPRCVEARVLAAAAASSAAGTRGGHRRLRAADDFGRLRAGAHRARGPRHRRGARAAAPAPGGGRRASRLRPRLRAPPTRSAGACGSASPTNGRRPRPPRQTTATCASGSSWRPSTTRSASATSPRRPGPLRIACRAGARPKWRSRGTATTAGPRRRRRGPGGVAFVRPAAFGVELNEEDSGPSDLPPAPAPYELRPAAPKKRRKSSNKRVKFSE